ncbi:hypothetical protein [Calderihabitans maritimus]|uniref:Uncharacterized protein n=1 Tax=Calderihabitans maritimus TaxID=1246530 RepID=A0A1Z5HP56_9FIRM|nr:hypothetical protein [Calderihabitans maritimus]GAW91316.1 hypothetical protein DEFDS_0895 [Calderihabitans maritimus]
MLRVLTFEAKTAIRDQTEMESLISYLRNKGYLAVIRGMFTGMFRQAKLPEPDEQLITNMITVTPEYRFMTEREDFLGDLFITDDIIYVLNTTGKGALQASAIGYGEQKEALQKFCTDVQEGIKTKFDGRRVRGMDFDWKPSSFLPLRYTTPFGVLIEEERAQEVTDLRVSGLSGPNYSSEDIKAANLLVDVNIRQFVLKLAQVRKMISRDATNLAKEPDTLERLLALDLIAEEYLLTCKQDQHTICIVPSKDHLTQEPMASLRCNTCERSFPEENLQVIYTLTDKGKRLIDGSLWMHIWITELLKESGVKKESIKWNIEASGEELDIMVEDFGSRFFLELKDREFGLGDAYPFLFRITRYGGKLGIVVTMDKVSTDAKKFFEKETRRRGYPIRIQYLEGPENIRKGIT